MVFLCEEGGRLFVACFIKNKNESILVAVASFFGWLPLMERFHFLKRLVVSCGPGALHCDLGESEVLDGKGTQKWPIGGATLCG